MKTTIIAGSTPIHGYYWLEHLENKEEMLRLIEQAESKLEPCPCCERLRPELVYRYKPECKENYHRFWICCSATLPVDGKFLGGCGIRSAEWCASDDPDDADIRNAIWLCFQKWNQRPGLPFPDYPFAKSGTFINWRPD